MKKNLFLGLFVAIALTTGFIALNAHVTCNSDAWDKHVRLYTKMTGGDIGELCKKCCRSLNTSPQDIDKCKAECTALHNK